MDADIANDSFSIARHARVPRKVGEVIGSSSQIVLREQLMPLVYESALGVTAPRPSWGLVFTNAA